jgi:hypothetical protein
MKIFCYSVDLKFVLSVVSFNYTVEICYIGIQKFHNQRFLFGSQRRATSDFFDLSLISVSTNGIVFKILIFAKNSDFVDIDFSNPLGVLEQKSLLSSSLQSAERTRKSVKRRTKAFSKSVRH